jgi:DNA-binding transcriptional LysR family regulator
MQDLNDLYYFAQVVERGGFAAAARVLGVPKSKLSRRVAALEDRLGVRLIQRSTRRFSVTEVGQVYHRHCAAMIAEASAAQEAIDRTSAEPQGFVRVSCPVGLMERRVGDIISKFIADHPRVHMHIEVTNRRVDVIGEGFDIALRVRTPPLEDTGLVIRVLEGLGSVLVASPALLDATGRPREPDDLHRFATMDFVQPEGAYVWRLIGPNGATREVVHRPRLVTNEMTTLRRAALQGAGAAALPRFLVEDDLANGTLEIILPSWTLPRALVHAVFPSRRGLLPAVRTLVDRLAAGFAEARAAGVSPSGAPPS